MPSIADAKHLVKQQLTMETDHDAILANLQDEIDRHNAATEQMSTERSHRNHRRDTDASGDEDRKRRHMRFRFKSGVEEPKRKRTNDHSRHKRRKKGLPPPDTSVEASAHPFPREPVDQASPDPPSNSHAFRSSLFDALADDEAASYWESVYSQPIHVYPRPTQQTPSGELESMDDETYAAYVQRKMWEKAHPEVVIERDRMERKRQEEAEARERRKGDFLRSRQREARERAERSKGTRKGEENDYEYVFDFSEGGRKPLSQQPKKPDEEVYEQSWSAYLSAWEKLKAELADPPSPSINPPKAASKKIPWPTLHTKPATRPNIEDFMQHIPASDDSSKGRLQALKVERVRWHPDKVQQRFRGEVNEGTMKVVTGVFQVVDTLLEEERKRLA